MIKRGILFFLGIWSTFLVTAQSSSNKWNVLFIAVDDLRPELGCYGNKYVYSPNIDALASGGVVFMNHYVTVPTCGASRASILTGKLPRTVQDLSNEAMEHKLKGVPSDFNPETFVHAFRLNGYYTVGIGKISHAPDGYIYKYQEPKSNRLELPQSWDEMLFNAGKWGTGWNAFFGYTDGTNRNALNGEVKPYEAAHVSDDAYPDGLTAALAVQKLQELASRNQPFFLAVGFFKPHLPFNAPKKYWDLYEEEQIPLAPFSDIPEGVNETSLHNSAEFNGYKKGEEKASLRQAVSDAYALKLRHAYLAGVSYVDAQIGKVLDALKKLHLEENTIVIVWGDHGWHLGDQRVWGKHTLSEWSLRSPLIIKVPSVTKAYSCKKIVSSVDIYPTLTELCDVKVKHQSDGRSLIPLLKNLKDKNWENVAYSYFRRGISMRTERYRLTKYFRTETPAVELFDYDSDPFERKNMAGEHPEIVERLTKLWEKGNTGIWKAKGG